jgi:hypothetical protein
VSPRQALGCSGSWRRCRFPHREKISTAIITCASAAIVGEPRHGLGGKIRITVYRNSFAVGSQRRTSGTLVGANNNEVFSKILGLALKD